MSSAKHIRPRNMYSVMNPIRGGIERPYGTAIDDGAGMVDADEVGGFDEGKVEAEGVDPEGGGFDGIADGDVASNAFIETVFGEDAEGTGEFFF